MNHMKAHRAPVHQTELKSSCQCQGRGRETGKNQSDRQKAESRGELFHDSLPAVQRFKLIYDHCPPSFLLPRGGGSAAFLFLQNRNIFTKNAVFLIYSLSVRLIL